MQSWFNGLVRSRALVIGMVGLGVALVPACRPEDRKTQITVSILSETDIPKELDSLEVVIIDADGSETSRVLHDVQNPRFFPATLAVVPRSSSSLDRAVTVELRGYLNRKDAQVFRRAKVSYVEGRTLLLPMPLRMACFNFRGCGSDETCAGGTCQSAKVDAASLADFDERLVFGRAAPEACFDEDTCLADSVRTTVRPSDCSFAVPAEAIRDGERVRANVSIRWKAADNRVIVLDSEDEVEGWTFDASTKRGKLSPGVCESLLDQESDPKKRRVYDQALDVWISTRCAAKVGLQPFCTSKDGHVATGTVLPQKP